MKLRYIAPLLLGLTFSASALADSHHRGRHHSPSHRATSHAVRVVHVAPRVVYREPVVVYRNTSAYQRRAPAPRYDYPSRRSAISITLNFPR
jgi:hypothetical protein